MDDTMCKKHPAQRRPCGRCSDEWNERKRRQELTEVATHATTLRKAAARGDILPGRKSVYRGKNRAKPIQVYLTDEGLRAFEFGQRKKGMSRPDYVEYLAIKEAKELRGG